MRMLLVDESLFLRGLGDFSVARMSLGALSAVFAWSERHQSRIQRVSHGGVGT